MTPELNRSYCIILKHELKSIDVAIETFEHDRRIPDDSFFKVVSHIIQKLKQLHNGHKEAHVSLVRCMAATSEAASMLQKFEAKHAAHLDMLLNLIRNELHNVLKHLHITPLLAAVK